MPSEFYEIAGALDSYVRAGLDVADDFVWVNDFLGARNIIEDFVLPFIQRHSMVGKNAGCTQLVRGDTGL